MCRLRKRKVEDLQDALHLTPHLHDALLDADHLRLGAVEDTLQPPLHSSHHAHVVALDGKHVLRARGAHGLHHAAHELLRVQRAALIVVKDAEEVLGLPQVNAKLLQVLPDLLVLDLLQELLLGQIPVAVLVRVAEDLVDPQAALLLGLRRLLLVLGTLALGLVKRVLDNDGHDHIHNRERGHVEVGEEEELGPRLPRHGLAGDLGPALRGRDLEEREHAPWHGAEVLLQLPVLKLHVADHPRGKDPEDVQEHDQENPRPQQSPHRPNDARDQGPELVEEAEEPEDARDAGQADDPYGVQGAEAGSPRKEGRDHEAVNAGHGHQDEVENAPHIPDVRLAIGR
mmetsp:Transcript_81473/g.209796  ORF Transcript_81473/g.209796 Transcript_81473/m.209796 type:complete len:342 (+) Transcript_81473:313-1338(+)